jgi:hypothetical protein
MDITLDDGTNLKGFELSQKEYLEKNNDLVSDGFNNNEFGYFPDESGTKVIPPKNYKYRGGEIVDKVNEKLGRN